MIAVSQNMALGTPVVPFGAAEALTDGGMKSGATPDGTEFLQVFVTGDAIPILADDANLNVKIKQSVESDALDTTDQEICTEPTLGVGAIWQPVAQTIAQLPKFGAGAAVLPAKSDTAAKAASLSDAQHPLRTKAQQNPDKDTPPQPLANAAAPSDAGVLQIATSAATTAAIFSPDAPKPVAEPAPLPAVASQGGNAASAQLPALAKAVTPDSEIFQPTDTAPDAPHKPETPFSKLADLSITPTEPPKDLQPDPQITRSDPPASAAQTAWLQKWIGDVPTPPVSDASVGDQPDIAGLSGKTTAPAAALADAVHRKTGELTPAVRQIAVSDTKGNIQSTVTATQFKDSNLDSTPPFDAVNFVTIPATIAQPVVSPLSPSPGPASPIMPAAVSPTIVDMTKSGNDGPVELVLSPEELGRLTISIRHDGDFVRVTVIADRPETLDLMRRHGGDLLADLRQAGFSGASLNFGQGGQPRFANPQAATKSEPPQHLPPETKPTAPSRSRKGSGVDLRF